MLEKLINNVKGIATGAVLLGAMAVGGCTSTLPEADNQAPRSEKKVEIPKLELYISLKDDTIYRKKGFEIIKQYLAEEVGIDLDLKFVSYDEFQAQRLTFDKRTKIGFLERTQDEAASDMAEYCIESMVINNYSFFQKNWGFGESTKKEKDRLRNKLREGFFDSFKERALKRYNDRRITGESFTREGIVRLYFREENADERNFNEEDIALTQAKLFLHELGHMFTLWHSFEFSNDPVEGRVGDFVNIMSYFIPTEHGKYGFELNQFQKDQILDYVKGGETFKKMKECGFDSIKFDKKIAIERGYNKGSRRRDF